MSTDPSPPDMGDAAGWGVLDLMETVLRAESMEDLEQVAGPAIAQVLGASVVFLLLVDPQTSAPSFLHHGLPAEAARGIEALCLERHETLVSQADPGVRLAPALPHAAMADLALYPLRVGAQCVGVLGLSVAEAATADRRGVLQPLQRALGLCLEQVCERTRRERQLSQLNQYLTLSSVLSQPLGLHDLLEVALYCCMDVVSAEAASVMVLNEDKSAFHFYQVEGPAKPVLMAATFPATEGVAGYVLRTRESEIVNDAQNDPRLYARVDSQTGFTTRNMIAIPLVADEEPVGVLEVLNKAEDEDFAEEEQLLLVSFAEEIAFAIRNAMVFEYVADTYCKQRQGLGSCRGCERPLGSWTPCVRYREPSF